MTIGHGGRTGAWVVRLFAAASVLVVAATVLHVALSHRIVVVGSLSTLGLPAAVYLVASWCLAGGLVLLLAGRPSEGLGFIRAIAAWGAVLGAAVVTSVLGQAAVASAMTPLFAHPSAESGRTVMLRLGDGVRNDNLALYQGDGRRFELVDGMLPSPDVQSFATGHRMTVGPRGEEVLTYRGRDGRPVSVALPPSTCSDVLFTKGCSRGP